MFITADLVIFIEYAVQQHAINNVLIDDKTTKQPPLRKTFRVTETMWPKGREKLASRESR